MLESVSTDLTVSQAVFSPPGQSLVLMHLKVKESQMQETQTEGHMCQKRLPAGGPADLHRSPAGLPGQDGE